jgi:hypothetical protein
MGNMMMMSLPEQRLLQGAAVATPAGMQMPDLGHQDVSVAAKTKKQPKKLAADTEARFSPHTIRHSRHCSALSDCIRYDHLQLVPRTNVVACRPAYDRAFHHSGSGIDVNAKLTDCCCSKQCSGSTRSPAS